ncbi:hypothetical protein P7L54_07790 [Acinetobacter bereziniae]|uniref:hypothetical protein n=1 Tax=Acinetobacter bereziniae TaxID=106648 RepID=UPI001902F58D|nr:hypothetical protein [Acinetobacter bereziniae]MDG3555853.1 hypothetical protein [Acinetobacter bereziniae]MDP5999804.1 hypothetical protein [Acinetobacter bereziniae]QQC81238.1 hypothetical protein I9192_03785 [Acinetobacter bereziniae]UUN94343.1 hypothetical protein I9189_003785 [Acinetobacter bereziniae]WMW75408.1 hypothetical protein RG306_03780 [Acinetobacter bereziniae]
MNISQLICQAVRHYGASIELINHQTLRLNQADDLPQQCTDLVRKYKVQLIRHLQLQSCYELLEYIQQEGAEIELLDSKNIRLHHAERITDKEIQQVRQFKANIIEILSHSKEFNPETLDIAIQQEVIQTYFDRLERHRSNLRKINSRVENALVKPEHVRQDLIQKFALSQDQAQHYINILMEQRIFKYDSNFRFYLFPNFEHSALTAFQYHNSFA